jgi:putative protein-disulfide isomerase
MHPPSKPKAIGAGMPSFSHSLIYGFDPLCGWCYGFAPALEALRQARPDLPIQLVLGGLVTGERVGPYKLMHDYIRGASQRLKTVTGRGPSEQFFDKVVGPSSPLIGASVPPSAAIAQVRAQAPDQALAFAHLVQAAHFEDGADLNDPAIHAALAKRLGLDIAFDLPDPHALPSALAEEFQAARKLGVDAFPTLLLRGEKGFMKLPSVYDPQALIATVAEAERQMAAA